MRSPQCCPQLQQEVHSSLGDVSSSQDTSNSEDDAFEDENWAPMYKGNEASANGFFTWQNVDHIKLHDGSSCSWTEF
jgi:hypothetical protein